MNANEVIQSVRTRFKDDKRLSALFLSGSFGNETNDLWSDIDFLGIADPAHFKELTDDWRSHLASLKPVIHEMHFAGPSVLLNLVLEDWTRCDLLLADVSALQGRTRDTLQTLFDDKGLAKELPETIPYLGPNKQKIDGIIKEFIRVLGLLSVVHGRDETLTAVTGTTLLRNHLIDLMLETVPLNDKGGALHLNRLLTQEQRDALQSLPPLEATWPSILACNQALARLFFPLARKLAEDQDIPWPDAFEGATAAHLKETLGEAQVTW